MLKKVGGAPATPPKPSPFGEVKLRKSPHPAVMADISKGSPTLKHSQTNDKSAPWIESGTKVGKNGHSDLMEAIKNLP